MDLPTGNEQFFRMSVDSFDTDSVLKNAARQAERFTGSLDKQSTRFSATLGTHQTRLADSLDGLAGEIKANTVASTRIVEAIRSGNIGTTSREASAGGG